MSKHLMFRSDSVIIKDFSDRNARLWTTEAKLMKNFGQEKRRNFRNPPIFSHLKNKKKKAPANQLAFERSPFFNPGEPFRSVEQEPTEISKHENSVDSIQESIGEQQHHELQLPRIAHPQEVASQAPSEGVVESWLTTPQLNSILGQRKHESLFKYNLEEGLLKRIARRKVRRLNFGEINSKKVNQFGTACSPFHALATTEIEMLPFPSNLPMTTRMMSKGIICTTESELKSMQLTFPELDEEVAKKSSPKYGKKPFGQTKKLILLPLIKPSRSRLSENKKTSGCHLPRIPAVTASASLKWGKY